MRVLRTVRNKFCNGRLFFFPCSLSLKFFLKKTEIYCIYLFILFANHLVPNNECQLFYFIIFGAYKSMLTPGNCLEKFLQFSWQDFRSSCYGLVPRVEKEELVQGHPTVVSKMGLEFTVFQFLAWYFNQETGCLYLTLLVAELNPSGELIDQVSLHSIHILTSSMSQLNMS